MRDGQFAKLQIFRFLHIMQDAVLRIHTRDGTFYDLAVDALGNRTVDTTTARTLTKEESGATFFLNSSSEFATTLPDLAAADTSSDLDGLEYTFVVDAAPVGVDYTIVTADSDNIMYGNICSAEDAGGSVTVVADADVITFVAGQAIKGDYVHVMSHDGEWFMNGMCAVQAGMTTAST